MAFHHFPWPTFWKWPQGGHVPKSWLLTPQFVVKIYTRVKTSVFCHVHVDSSCFKIANNVTWLYSIASFSSPDWQPSWMLRPMLKSKLFVTNLSHIMLKNMYFEGNIVYLCQVEAEFTDNPNLGCSSFSTATIENSLRGYRGRLDTFCKNHHKVMNIWNIFMKFSNMINNILCYMIFEV